MILDSDKFQNVLSLRVKTHNAPKALVKEGRITLSTKSRIEEQLLDAINELSNQNTSNNMVSIL